MSLPPLAPRSLPLLPGQLPPSAAEVLDTVRTWTEWATNSDPGNMMDWSTYQMFQRWCKDESKRKLIEDILKSRLKCEPPSCHKALILAQLLPASTLSTLLDELKPLTSPPADSDTALPTTAYSSLAASLHASGAELKASDDAAGVVEKYEVWSRLYGRAEADWPGPPKEPEWGSWALFEVGKEDWWVLPNEPDGDEKE